MGAGGRPRSQGRLAEAGTLTLLEEMQAGCSPAPTARGQGADMEDTCVRKWPLLEADRAGQQANLHV